MGTNMRKLLLSSAFALAALVGIAPAQAQPSASHLRIGLAEDPDLLDPTLGSSFVGRIVYAAMCDKLFDLDEKLNIIPQLATGHRYESPTKLVITLRPGVTFHNGDSVTSADFQYGMPRQQDPKLSRFSHLLNAVEAFEVIDDLTFRLRFKEGDGSFITSNLHLWAMPKRHIEKVGEEEYQRAPVGTGPWKFVSRTVKEELRLEAYEGYWNKQNRPTAKTLVIKIIPEDLTRVAAYKTGAIDWIDAVPPAATAVTVVVPVAAV
jgi:peptide/nickel transport system substrate-binding protein